jgi:lambda family phage portal protein
MAQWLDNLARRFGYAKPAAGGRRDFAAAQLSRLTGGWSSSNVSANADLYRSLDTLRARSRDLCNNNDYAKRFLGMVAANVVGGNGFTLQARVYDKPGVPDTGANDAIEAAFARWAKRGVCDVTGRHSFRDVQQLVVKACARDGEALVRKVRGKSAGNKFGLALQVIDIDRLDTRLIRAAEGGLNEIRMGVEVDAFGRSVAYWLRGYHPGDSYGMAAGAVQAAHTRIPADEIIHVFIAERPEQLRGQPWMHAAMTRLNNLGGYEEAAVIAARVGASQMGFFTDPDGNTSNAIKDGEDAATGEIFMDADPGVFKSLPPGVTFEKFDPNYPAAMYGDFVKACLRGIASGLGVAYHALANDLEGVNFSSIRAGTLEERDQWVSVQEWMKDAFIEPVFDEWLGYALAMGQITLANGAPLPVEKIEKFSAHSFQGRRWSWVDPLKDMEAKILGIQNGLTSPQQVAAELGVDYEDILVELKAAQDMADKIGVKLGKPEAPAPKPADPAQEPAGVKALTAQVEALERIVERALQERQPMMLPAPATNVTVAVNADEMARAAHAVRDGLLEQTRELTAQIREDIQNMPIVIPAPVVNVAAPVVTVENRVEPAAVTLEATLPPAEITVSLPPRRTDTAIKYNANGDIVATTQIETDV